MNQKERIFGNPNYQGPFGNTLLHSAVISGDVQEIEQLLYAGADPTIANCDGRTPVDVAMILGRPDISNLLTMRIVESDAENGMSGAAEAQ